MSANLPDGSRVRREFHARFCERPRVRFPWPTHPTVPVLAPGTGKTRTGRLWVVVRDERPLGSVVPPAAYYRYSANCMGIHARRCWQLPRLPSCRWLCRLRSLYRPTTPNGEADAGRGGMLESRTPKVLRDAPRHSLADRAGGLGADRRPVRHRKQRPRTATRSSVAAREEHARPLLVQLKTFLT